MAKTKQEKLEAKKVQLAAARKRVNELAREVKNLELEVENETLKRMVSEYRKTEQVQRQAQPTQGIPRVQQ